MIIRSTRRAAAIACVAETLEARRLFDMVYPGNGPAAEAAADEPVAYTLGAKWTTTNLTYSFSNLLSGGLPGGLTAAALEAAIEEALQVWSAVSPLRFTEIADTGPAPSDATYTQTAGMAQIRIGHHYIDGGGDAPNTLAHAWLPSSSGLGGDLHFDNGNTWATHPANGVDIIEVATHELGHSLGLDHEDTNDAIMSSSYAGRYTGPGSAYLLADDINAIQAQYGVGLGYVVSDGTLFLSGTAAADSLAVDVSGTTFTLSNGTRTVSGSTGGITNVVVNARGGNDVITIKRTGGLVVSVNGGAGVDALTLSDKTGTFAGTYTTNTGSVSRTGLPNLGYSATESLALEGSDFDNTFTVNTGSVTIRTNGGSDLVNVNTDNSGTAVVTFDQADEHLTTLTVGGGGRATLKLGAKPMQNVLTVNTLQLAATGRLDLTNGGMIVDYASASPITSLGASLAQAYAYGAWTGSSGITSSAVGASGLYTVGIASAANALGISGADKAEWSGRTVDATSVLVRFTYAGDANLNGYVDAADYGVIDHWVQFPGTDGYMNGDFNYDGTVDAADYGIIDNTIQVQGPPL